MIEPVPPVSSPAPSPSSLPPPLPVPSPSPHTVQLSFRLRLVLLVVLGLVVLTVVTGLLYRFTRSAPPPPSPSPSLLAASPSPAATSFPLHLDALSLPYPSHWLVLFAPVTDAKTPDLTTLYFVRSEAEYLEYALCAREGSCTNAPLTLRYTAPQTIWIGYSLPDYLRATAPDLPLDKLTATTYAAQAGLAGYTDYQSLTHLALVKPKDNEYQQIWLTARTDTKDMLDLEVEYLNRLSPLPSSVSSPAALVSPQVFTLALSARLATTDPSVLFFILRNLFAPPDLNLEPSYFLYAETAAPPGNFLDYTYYLLTDNSSLLEKIYSSPQLSAALSPPPQEDMVPYLLDPKYCRESSDCLYRQSECQIDAFNRYFAFPPSSCDSLEYVGLGTSAALTKKLYCHQGLSVSYDSLECVSNQCVVHNPVPACKK